MKRMIIGILLVIFGGIVLHAPLSVGVGTLFPSYELFVKSWKEILMGIALALLLIEIYRKKQFHNLLSDKLIQIAGLYAFIHLLCLLLFPVVFQAVMAGLLIDLRYVLFFVLVYSAFKLYPGYRALFLKVGIAGAGVVVGFAVLQLFLPADILKHIGYNDTTIQPYLTVDKNPDFVRVNSTLRGPNPLGAYAVIVLGLLAAAFIRAKIKLQDKKPAVLSGILAVGSVIALWISYSRSALVAGVVTLLVIVLATVMRTLPRKAWIVAIAILFAGVGGLVAARDTSLVSNVLLHENPAGGSSISSNDDHVASLEYGLSQLLREPFGSGIGSTGSASLYGTTPTIVENQYLFIAHETGWLGLGLFLALFGMIMVRLWRNRTDWLNLGVFASGIGLGVIGLLLPVWADDTVSIIWWGLAAIALAGERHGRQPTKQKTARTA